MENNRAQALKVLWTPTNIKTLFICLIYVNVKATNPHPLSLSIPLLSFFKNFFTLWVFLHHHLSIYLNCVDGSVLTLWRDGKCSTEHVPAINSPHHCWPSASTPSSNLSSLILSQMCRYIQASIILYLIITTVKLFLINTFYTVFTKRTVY